MVGFGVFSWSVDKFVYGVLVLVKNIGIFFMMIGLIIVVMGLFVLEIVVLVVVFMSGNFNIVVGNVLGLNIINIGLVLGIIVLIKLLLVLFIMLKCEFLVLFVVNIIVVYFFFDGELSFCEGIILILLFIFVLVGMVWIFLLVEKGDFLMLEIFDEIFFEVEMGKVVMWIGVGLVLLLLSV